VSPSKSEAALYLKQHCGRNFEQLLSEAGGRPYNEKRIRCCIRVFVKAVR